MKCFNCDKKIKSSDTYCSNCGTNLKKVEIINDVQKESNKIFYLVIIILVLISISLSACFFIKNDSKEKNNEKDSIVSENEVMFKNYILEVPEGFTKSDDKKNTYIQSDELIIVYKEYPVSFEKINSNKELLNDTLNEQGYVIEKYSVRKIDDKEYIVINAKLNDVDYCLIFYEIDSDTNIFLTISSNYLSKYQDNWTDIGINFINSIKKI